MERGAMIEIDEHGEIVDFRIIANSDRDALVVEAALKKVIPPDHGGEVHRSPSTN